MYLKYEQKSVENHLNIAELLLNHVLRTKILPRSYESIGGNETKRLILEIKEINCEGLADPRLGIPLEGPLWCCVSFSCLNVLLSTFIYIHAHQSKFKFFVS